MGITATEIHVAVIADVDNPIVPNLFKGSKDAVEGAAKFLNSKAGGGGLAGRKVVVDFYDSKLNANATTNAEISACENDVAVVGTSAVSLASVDEMRNCKDSTGAVDGSARHPVRVDRARAAVLGPVVPDGPAAGDLLDGHGQHPRRSSPTSGAATTTTRSSATTCTASTSSGATRSQRP